MYTDENGEAWWLIPVITAAIFAGGNTAIHAIKGDIQNFWDGFKFFAQGAVTGFALGCTWTFTGAAYLGGMSGLLGTTGNVIHTSMNIYAVSQAGIGAVGMIGGAIKDGWSGLGRAGKIFLGNFYMDENNWLNGLWQGYSRHTWEMPQSLIGHGYTHFRNVQGNVSRVDYLGGATFATNENSSKHNGVTLGSYINMNIREKITGDFDTYATTRDPMYMHEYGHTIDSRLFGLSYLFAIGIPSGISASKDGKNNYDHDYFWTEIRANRHAKKYFKKFYNVNWDYPDYPLK